MPAITRIATESLRCAAGLLLLAAATPGYALDLAALLGCRDTASLALPADDLHALVTAVPGARCKRIELHGRTATECELAKPLSVFGLPVAEFSVSHGRGRSVRARSVFRAGATRLAQFSAAALRVALAADEEGGFRAELPGSPPHRVSAAPREDGASIFICETDMASDRAEDILAGVDRARGGIAGRLSFPDGSLPPMRVCAIPRDPWLRTRCTLTREGQADYLITGLAPGDYDVASFALSGNSNGLVGAHARRLEDCAPNEPGCAGGILVPRRVHAGEVTTDVDPDRFYTQLPPRFDVVKAPE